MATRNILDSFGNVIGQLTLPDETSEGAWTAALAPYTLASYTPPISPVVATAIISGSGSVTTSSAQASTVGSMTYKPAAGTYLIDFNGGIYTGGASATGEFGLYVDSVLLAETRRDISCNLALLGGLVTISLNAIGVGTFTGSQVDLNGSQTVEVKFKSTNGGTIGFNERVLRLMRVK